RPLAADHHRLLLARREPRGIPVALVVDRRAAIVLLDVALELGEQLVLERLDRIEDRPGVGVLGLEVADHVGALAGVVAQPVVRIVAIAAGRLDQVRPAIGDRRPRAGLRLEVAGLRRGRGGTAGAEREDEQRDTRHTLAYHDSIADFDTGRDRRSYPGRRRRVSRSAAASTGYCAGTQPGSSGPGDSDMIVVSSGKLYAPRRA